MRKTIISLLTAAMMVLSVTACLAAQQKAGARPSETAKRKRAVTNLGFEVGGQSQTGQPVQTVGATRGEVGQPVQVEPSGPNAPVLFAPQLGRCYASRPTFYWRMPEGVNSSKLVLADASREIGSWEVTGSSFTLPADAAELKPGEKYFWRVELKDGSRSATLGVVVLGGSERQSVATALDAASRLRSPLLAGNERVRVFTEHRLWYDVLDEYNRMLEKFPQETSLYEKRGQIFAQLPVTQPEAEADFARAERRP